MKLPRFKWPSIKMPKIDSYYWVWAISFSAALSIMVRLVPEFGMMIIAIWGMTMFYFGSMRIEAKFLKEVLESLEQKAGDSREQTFNLRKESIEAKARADSYEIASADWQGRCRAQHKDLQYALEAIQAKTEAITALKLELGKLKNDYGNAHMLRRMAEGELATTKLELIKLKEK